MKPIRSAWLAFATITLAGSTAMGQVGPTAIHAPAPAAVLRADTGVFQDASVAPATTSTFPSLKPRSLEREAPLQTSDSETRVGRLATPAVTVTSSLIVVLGLFAALVWGSRKFGQGSLHAASIPREVMQPLGSMAIDARTHVTMVRCGNRILLLGQTSSSIQTLCEITDPNEIQHLTAACLGGAKQDFAVALRSLEKEKAGRAFVDADANPGTTSSRRRLFASA